MRSISLWSDDRIALMIIQHYNIFIDILRTLVEEHAQRNMHS